MLACSGVLEPLRQPEIHHIDDVLILANSNEEIVRFDVSVKNALVVQIFYSLQHLVSDHEH